MRIYKKIVKDILNDMPSTPPEAGGILGGKDGKVCLWEFDKGYEERRCVYRPNIDYLNAVIAKWIENGYDFMGILHVHFGGAEHLSDGDKKYIQKIMNTMPCLIKELFFPIVVQPGRKIVSYKAIRNVKGEVIIVSDNVEAF